MNTIKKVCVFLAEIIFTGTVALIIIGIGISLLLLPVILSMMFSNWFALLYIPMIGIMIHFDIPK